MDDIFYPLLNDKYNKGILLQEYQGTYYLVSAKEGKDAKIYSDWCFPQGKDRQPIEKSMPWKIKLGESKEEAFAALAFFGKLLKPKP